MTSAQKLAVSSYFPRPWYYYKSNSADVQLLKVKMFQLGVQFGDALILRFIIFIYFQAHSNGRRDVSVQLFYVSTKFPIFVKLPLPPTLQADYQVTFMYLD